MECNEYGFHSPWLCLSRESSGSSSTQGLPLLKGLQLSLPCLPRVPCCVTQDRGAVPLSRESKLGGALAGIWTTFPEEFFHSNHSNLEGGDISRHSWISSGIDQASHATPSLSLGLIMNDNNPCLHPHPYAGTRHLSPGTQLSALHPTKWMNVCHTTYKCIVTLSVPGAPHSLGE